MECARCHASLDAEECREYEGKKLCEDCYLEAVNPPKACDPWAVHLAKSDKGRSGVQLTPSQQKLYDLVKQRGMITFPEAAQQLGVSEEEVRRDFATLRHLELLRGHKQGQQVFIALF
jgi:predicted HTH transcriptional regulator|uniref:DeoR family transcriptional regulator n=1 Tax=Desulfobacca acetoxidans TaxID=60893 RepID=A0A7C3V426_9BACT